MSKVFCPVCNSEVILPKTSEVVIGTTISEESKGNYTLPMRDNKGRFVKKENTTMMNTKENRTMTKTDARMAALKAAGADMNRYFKISLPTGGDMLMEMKNGVPTPVLFDVDTEIKSDEVVEQIITDGYVRNSKLHRRWVLAQMWEMLNYKSYRGDKNGYNYALTAKGYAYQWDVIMDEIYVLSKLEVRDRETFLQRVHFFNKDVVIKCAQDYIYKLNEKINEMSERHCKGIPYKKIAGQDIFCSDIWKKVIQPITTVQRQMIYARNYAELYRAVVKFRNITKKYKLNNGVAQAKEFKDAFKGAGAYYSLRNLLQFHNCDLILSDYEMLRGRKAVEYIESKLDEYQGEGYRYFAMMKKCIADNQWVPNWK